MSRKQEAMTFEEAINTYFGGVHALVKMSFPLTCKCGQKGFTGDTGGTLPIMTLDDCFKHIRRTHKERIKNKVEPKAKQLGI